MAIYVYKVLDGTLVSYCPNDTDPVAPTAILEAQGLAARSGLPPLDSTHQWSPASQTVVTVTVAAPPKLIATSSWIMRFTPAEFAAIRASTDSAVQEFMYALLGIQQISLADPVIVNGVNYLVSINLLASSRVAAIMA